MPVMPSFGDDEEYDEPEEEPEEPETPEPEADKPVPQPGVTREKAVRALCALRRRTKNETARAAFPKTPPENKPNPRPPGLAGGALAHRLGYSADSAVAGSGPG